ncbi:MAG TPA: hypothetical protein VIF14_14275 [Alphaproteobacteria bacterium]|jgi:hypothetical protein
MTLRSFARPLARAFALALPLAVAMCGPDRPAFAEAATPAACGAYRELAETLRQRFGETMRFHAEENRGFALEFFANADGSWTLVMRRGDEACAIAAGAAWQPGAESAF